MSDYPMLISNKLHSFRNFGLQKYEKNTEMTYDCRMPFFYFVKVLVCSRIEIMLPFLRRACARYILQGVWSTTEA